MYNTRLYLVLTSLSSKECEYFYKIRLPVINRDFKCKIDRICKFCRCSVCVFNNFWRRTFESNKSAECLLKFYQNFKHYVTFKITTFPIFIVWMSFTISLFGGIIYESRCNISDRKRKIAIWKVVSWGAMRFLTCLC